MPFFIKNHWKVCHGEASIDWECEDWFNSYISAFHNLHLEILLGMYVSFSTFQWPTPRTIFQAELNRFLTKPRFKSFSSGACPNMQRLFVVENSVANSRTKEKRIYLLKAASVKFCRDVPHDSRNP